MIDYHIHTRLSTDCSVSMERMALAAQEKGIKYISFTDHIDFDFPGVEFMVDFDEYIKEFDDVKSKYPGINIAKGIEAGLEPDSFIKYKELLKDKELDFVIGSVHVVFGHDPYFDGLWKNVSKQEAFDEYARLSLLCLDSLEIFDSLGHLGYISKYCPYQDRLFRYSDYVDIVDTILKKLIENSKSLEINTSGLITTGELIPEKPIIQRYKSLGGEMVTLGSDAHIPGNLGLAADETLSYLKHIGFKYVCAYKKRIPEFITLP